MSAVHDADTRAPRGIADSSHDVEEPDPFHFVDQVGQGRVRPDNAVLQLHGQERRGRRIDDATQERARSFVFMNGGTNKKLGLERC